jgi:hypothetical protein
MSNRQNTDRALILRVTACDGKSHGGFQWPLEVGAAVIAPDWQPTQECGNGLHGWLYGVGDHTVANFQDDSQWLVVEVVLSECVMLGGKVKFPRCVVRFVGDRKSATDYLIANETRARNVAVIGAQLAVGDDHVVQVGASGTATAGYGGTATAGYRGTATAGDRGTATAGNSGEIRIRYYDLKADRYRTSVGYIGEDGLKPRTPYRLNNKHEFEEVEA